MQKQNETTRHIEMPGRQVSWRKWLRRCIPDQKHHNTIDLGLLRELWIICDIYLLSIHPVQERPAVGQAFRVQTRVNQNQMKLEVIETSIPGSQFFLFIGRITSGHIISGH